MTKAEYRRLCKMYHPDGTNPDPAKFKAIQEEWKNPKDTRVVDMFKSYAKGAEKVDNESKFKAEVRQALESLGGKVVKLWGNMFQETGLPDLYVAHVRWNGWIELKVGKRKAEPRQKIVMSEFVARHVAAMVLRFREDGLIQTETEEGEVLQERSWEGTNIERAKILIAMLQVSTMELAAKTMHRVGDYDGNGVSVMKQ